MQDVHGQIRVRRGKLGVELVLKGPVDGVPEGAAARGDGCDVLGCRGAGWGCRELGGDFFGETGAEGVEAVDCAGDAVETDAFEADFAHEFGRLDRGGRVGRGSELVEGCEGFGGVHGHCCSGLVGVSTGKFAGSIDVGYQVGDLPRAQAMKAARHCWLLQSAG